MIFQQEDNLPVRKLLLIAMVGVLVTVGSVSWLSWYISARRRALNRPAPTSAGPVAPRELAGVQQTLIHEAGRGQRMREAAERRLESYRWLDEDAGVVQVPIDVAMQVILERKGGEE